MEIINNKFFTLYYTIVYKQYFSGRNFILFRCFSAPTHTHTHILGPFVESHDVTKVS